MNEEEGRHNDTVEAFSMAEKSNQELKKKLLEVEKERKYAVATLESTEKQVESQKLLLRTAEDNLATSKTQIASLKKKLEEVEKAKVLAEKVWEEVEKAKDEAEQHDYNVGMAETEDALRAEVPTVRKTYCALTWGEALNQTRVEASSVLKKAGSVYYLPAIRLTSSSDSKADLSPSKAGEVRGSPPKAPPAADTSSKGRE